MLDNCSQLLVRSVGRIDIILLDEIDWLAGAGNYVEVGISGDRVLHRASLQALATQLDPARFIRIHRSAIICRRAVRSVRCVGRARIVVARDGREFRISRPYRHVFDRWLRA